MRQDSDLTPPRWLCGLAAKFTLALPMYCSLFISKIGSLSPNIFAMRMHLLMAMPLLYGEAMSASVSYPRCRKRDFTGKREKHLLIFCFCLLFKTSTFTSLQRMDITTVLLINSVCCSISSANSYDL